VDYYDKCPQAGMASALVDLPLFLPVVSSSTRYSRKFSRTSWSNYVSEGLCRTNEAKSKTTTYSYTSSTRSTNGTVRYTDSHVVFSANGTDPGYSKVEHST
jgi:hypothetical protein